MKLINNLMQFKAVNWTTFLIALFLLKEIHTKKLLKLYAKPFISNFYTFKWNYFWLEPWWTLNVLYRLIYCHVFSSYWAQAEIDECFSEHKMRNHAFLKACIACVYFVLLCECEIFKWNNQNWKMQYAHQCSLYWSPVKFYLSFT